MPLIIDIAQPVKAARLLAGAGPKSFNDTPNIFALEDEGDAIALPGNFLFGRLEVNGVKGVKTSK